MTKPISRFTFRQHDRVGDPSAETDQFLKTCFVDNGNIQILTDCDDSRSIVAGRTGSGKSALLCHLNNTRERVIVIDPSTLALGYISNSTILSFFSSIGVKLDLFYRFLWRHVLIVELLKESCDIQCENDKIKWFVWLKDKLSGKRGRIEAFEYLNTWGNKFWTTTEVRIKELTTSIEKELSGHVGLDIAKIATMHAGGNIHLNDQQTYEIKTRGENVISQIQMSKLTAIIDCMDEDILTDRQQKYYIIIDKLDESWVEEDARIRLIRGLIEAVRHFNSKIRHAKIILALRTDLLDTIYSATSDSGFQQEKYTALNLRVSWSREDLITLLDKRVELMVRQRYTRQTVKLDDILPGMIGKHSNSQTLVDYLLDRTMNRPRDAIQFLNICMANATNEAVISPKVLLKAEIEYSQKRRAALADEWSIQYPNLTAMTNILKGRPCRFRLGDIEIDDLDEICVEMLTSGDNTGIDFQRFNDYFENRIRDYVLRKFIAHCFYKTGIVGLKLTAHHPTVWSNEDQLLVSTDEINDNVSVAIHKMFWRDLGISDGNSDV